MKLSKRKLESYKRAEKVAREVRYQLEPNGKQLDLNKTLLLVCDWMKVTGKISYERP